MGYLRALRVDHIEMPQRPSWSLDQEPDHLAGLAAAIKGVAVSRATLVQKVREHILQVHCHSFELTAIAAVAV